jgi:hypothetical protein
MSKGIYSKKSEKLSRKALHAYREGRHKTDIHHARLLEDKLRRDQYNVLARCALLGYYRHAKSKDAPKRWCRHAEWIIKTSPDQGFIPFVLHVPQDVTPEQLEDLKEIFLQKVKRNPKNANVAGHAAMFFNETDDKTAGRLFKVAMKLAPDNEWWHRQYVDRHVRKAHGSKQKKHIDSAYAKGLKFVKKFEKEPNHRASTGMILRSLFNLALESSDFDMAHRILKKIKKSQWTKLFPYARHECAGLLAVKEKNIEAAKSHLLKMAKQLNGKPKLLLPNELVEIGEGAAVVEYFEVCLQRMGAEMHEKDVLQIKKWIQELEGDKSRLSDAKGI